MISSRVMPASASSGSSRLASLPRAFRCEGPKVHLVDDLPFERHPRPGAIGPLEGAWIDDLGGTMRPARLKTRDGIRIQGWVAIETITVQRPGTCRGDQGGEIARRLGLG